MRFKLPLLVGVLLVVALFAANRDGRARGPAVQTWEYKVVTAQYGAVPPAVGEQELNKLGAEGWELIGTRQIDYPQGTTRQYRTDYYFKRVR